MGSRSGMLALGALQRELPLGGHEARDPQLGIHGGCRLPVLQASSPFLLSSRFVAAAREKLHGSSRVPRAAALGYIGGVAARGLETRTPSDGRGCSVRALGARGVIRRLGALSAGVRGQSRWGAGYRG